MKIFFSLFFLFSIHISHVFAQKPDSLLQVARATKNDSVKIRMYNKIGFSYIFNDPDKAIQVLREGKKLAEEKHFNFGLTELINTCGIYMDITGKLDSAQYYFIKALNKSRVHHFSTIENMCLNNLGMFNWNRGHYKEALSYFFESLKMDDISGDDKAASVPLNNIGLIYQEMNLYEKALQYHKKSLDIRIKYKLKNDQIGSLNNIGICYNSLGRIDEAIAIYKDGITLAKETNNLLDYYRILDNLGNSYQSNKTYNKAIETFLKALEKPDKYRADLKGDISIYANIISAYNAINKPRLALVYAKKGFDVLSDYTQYNHFSADLYFNAAESYYMLNNLKKAKGYVQKSNAIRDSIFSKQNAEAIAHIEVKYQTEKKEKEILLQRADLAEKELHINQKNTQIIGLGVLTLVLSLLGYLLYNQQKLKNIQQQKEGELKVALVKIETHNRLQEQRLRISRDLHDNIGAQLTFIISSIENLKYGFKIKNEKLTNKLSGITDFTKETIYELRDTIWAMNKNEISITDLQSRISNLIEKANTTSNTLEFYFDIDKTISKNLKFTSVKGMNIYRIIQEAINNAIKYAETSKIEVLIKKKNTEIEISITDVGKGFNIEEITLGNGLNNIKKRAQYIGANVIIDSEKGRGTSVVLKVS